MKECDFCGTKNEDWMKICINCGRDLKDAKTPDAEEEKKENEQLSRVGKQDNTNLYLTIAFVVLLILFFILLTAVLSRLK